MKKYQVIIICVTALLCLSACAGGNMSTSGKYIKRKAVFKNDRGYGADIIRYRPDGKHIAVTGSRNPFIYIYDVATGERLHKLDKQNETNGNEISYDGNGKYLVYVSDSSEKQKHYFVVRDVNQGYKILRQDIRFIGWGNLYPAPDGKIIQPSFMSHNFGLGKGKPKFRLYTPPDMNTEEFWHNSEGFGSSLKNAKFAISPNGKYMVDVLAELKGKPQIWDDLYHLRVWKYPEMQLIKTIKNAHKHSIISLAWSLDSKILYTGAAIGFKMYGLDVKLWDTASWTEIEHYQSKEWQAGNVAFLPDNRHLFGGAGGGTRLLQLFDVYSGKITEEIPFPCTYYAYTLEQNPMKKNQFAFGYEDDIWIYEIETPVVE